MSSEEDRIQRQIEGIGDRRALGCIVKGALALLAGGLFVYWVERHYEDAAARLMAMLAVSGLLFGYATSYLSPPMRRVLQVVFATVPVLIAGTMFVMRTVVGWSEDLPLRFVATPLAISLGFFIGHIRRGD